MSNLNTNFQFKTNEKITDGQKGLKDTSTLALHCLRVILFFGNALWGTMDFKKNYFQLNIYT